MAVTRTCVQSACLLLAGLMLALAGCGGEDGAASQGSGGITVSDVWSRPVLTAELGATPGDHHHAGPTATDEHAQHPEESAGANGVVYMTIENDSDQDDRLIGARASVAAAAEIHEVQMDGSVMRMRQAPGIDIPAGATVSLEPTGFHIMLVGLHENLEPGDEIEVALDFEHAGTITVASTVREERP